jgi:hypothetical protein
MEVPMQIVVLLFLVSATSLAEAQMTLNGLPLDETGYKLVLELQEPQDEQRGSKKSAYNLPFWLIAGGVVTSSILDIESTFTALERCNGRCREGNPVMAPLVKAGRPLVYTSQMATNVAIISYSAWLKPRRPKSWWIPAVSVTAVHTVLAVRNTKWH